MELKESLVNAVQALTDDVLTFVVVIPATVMAYNQIALPDWYILAVGLVISFYFKK